MFPVVSAGCFLRIRLDRGSLVAITSEVASSEVPSVRRHLHFVPLLMMLSFFLINYLAAQGVSCGSRAQWLQPTGVCLVVLEGLSCPVACGILVPRPLSLCIRRQVLNHWTPGDVIFDHLVKVVSAQFSTVNLLLLSLQLSILIVNISSWEVLWSSANILCLGSPYCG